MTMKATHWKTGEVVAVLMVLLAQCPSAIAGDLKSAIALLEGRDISRFVKTVVKERPASAPYIYSEKMSDQPGKRDPDARILGQELIETLQSPQSLSVPNPGARTVEMLDIRDWAVQRAAYGNLLIAYAAEAAAIRQLFRVLASGKNGTDAVEIHIERLRTGSPNAAYWLGVLKAEDVQNLLLEEDVTVQESEKKALLLRKLTSKTAAIDIVPGIPSGDIKSSYQRRSFPQVAFIAAVQDLELAALQACIAAIRRSGSLPSDEAEFKAVIRESAEGILRDRNRAAGPLTSGQVWRLWKAYTLSDPAKP